MVGGGEVVVEEGEEEEGGGKRSDFLVSFPAGEEAEGDVPVVEAEVSVVAVQVVNENVWVSDEVYGFSFFWKSCLAS